MATPQQIDAALAALASSVSTLDGAVAADWAVHDPIVPELTAARAGLQAIIDRTEPPPPPDPGKLPHMLIGACPATSGSPPQVVTKYGAGVSIRDFYTGWKASEKPAGCRSFYPSWKPPLGSTITDGQVITALGPCDDGDVATLHHETPTKVRDGRMTSAQAQQALALMNDFHARVVRLRTAGTIPHVLTCFCDAAWMWDVKSGLYPGSTSDIKTAAWWLSRVDADLLGPDMDAYGNLTKYPDFLAQVVPNVVASVHQYGFDGWCVPEFIHPRTAADTDGTQRAAWITRQFDGMRALPEADQPVGIWLFDTEWQTRPNQSIVKPSKEHTAIMAAIAKIPA